MIHAFLGMMPFWLARWYMWQIEKKTVNWVLILIKLGTHVAHVHVSGLKLSIFNTNFPLTDAGLPTERRHILVPAQHQGRRTGDKSDCSRYSHHIRQWLGMCLYNIFPILVCLYHFGFFWHLFGPSQTCSSLELTHLLTNLLQGHQTSTYMYYIPLCLSMNFHQTLHNVPYTKVWFELDSILYLKGHGHRAHKAKFHIQIIILDLA